MKKSETLNEEVITTEVLVVGAGTGGMMAAISATDSGASVILCEKGNVKRSGGIRGGNDHFPCYIPEIHSPSMREKLIRHDEFVNIDKDVRAKLWDLTHKVLKKWESWGVNTKLNGRYEFALHAWPDEKAVEQGKINSPWLHFSDYKLSEKLEKQVRKRNVEIMNRVMVNELLQDSNGHVVGAVGISTREPKLYIFQTRSIVYNTGGIGPTRLFPSVHVRDYSIAEPETGDGDMMAYRAGADLYDAELSYRHVGMTFGPFYGQGSWIGVVRDSEGNPIAPPYLKRPDAKLGDVSAMNTDAHDHVWSIGRGPVWMDPRQLSSEDEEYLRWGFESEAMQPFLRWLEEENIEIRKTRFEFGPKQFRSNLKTRTDQNFKTTLDGLYSTLKAGLSRSATSGMIAGESAAEYATNSEFKDLERYHDRIAEIKQGYEKILNREGPQYADWREVQWAIYQVMQWYALPPRRSESTLMAGYRHILRLKEKTRQILKAANQHDLYHCLEVLNLLDAAELVLLTTNERKESRGQSRRLDYPFINPMNDNKILVITNKENKPILRWEDIR